MKFQKIIRMQLLLAGAAALLLLPGYARAQQDVDPTTFDVNPGVPQTDNAAPVRSAQNLPPATPTEAQPLAAAESIDTTQITIADSLIMLTLMGCAGMLVLRGIAEGSRLRKPETAS